MTARQRRVAVTGLGVVSPFGRDTAEFFRRVMAGDSAVRPFVSDGGPHPMTVPAVSCPDFDVDSTLGRAVANTMDRYSQLGAVAAFSAWDDAGFPRGEKHWDAGVCWGTALGGTLTFEQGYREFFTNGRARVPPFAVILGMPNAAAAHISIKLGLGESSLTYSIACASSSTAIGEAFQRVRHGQARVMVAGGSDALLSYAVIRAWDALRVMAPLRGPDSRESCRPFHRQREGLVLGEGAAALVLEDWDHAVQRGARIYAELVGYGTNCDHAHLVRPEAEGQTRAMNMALADAGSSASEVDYINAHGTATREGDPIEIQALKDVLGARAPEVAVSATKSIHGHLMGAAGAMEAMITVLALQQQAIPPTANLDEVDPACEGVRHVPHRGITGERLRLALSNSFAFGGTNAVLAFRKVS